MNQTDIKQRLAELGLDLPAVTPPVAAYIPARRAGSLLFVSGQLPFEEGKLMATGTVPSAVSEETAKRCARRCALNAIAAAAAALGADERITGVIRIGCWVASDAGFGGQPAIANGASELMVEVFGDAGRHARAAVGSITLPLSTPVEVEALFEIG